jgi:hypothetical protein
LTVLNGLQAGVVFAATATPPTTSNPLVTIVGGSNTSVVGVGSHNDSSDLYGILLVIVVIAVSIVVARWVFGRGVQSSGER